MEIGIQITFAKNLSLAEMRTMAEVESFPSPRPADRLDLGNFLFSGSLFTFPYHAKEFGVLERSQPQIYFFLRESNR